MTNMEILQARINNIFYELKDMQSSYDILKDDIANGTNEDELFTDIYAIERSLNLIDDYVTKTKKLVVDMQDDLGEMGGIC